MLKSIKVQLEGVKGTWPEELPGILWAYKTTTKTPTGETPFNLTYDTKAVIPVEIGVTSKRREFFDKETNDDQLWMNLDCLDETRDEASKRMARYQQKMAGYYDQRVKLRRFNIGDLVLQKVTPTTKDSTHGKLGPTWKAPTKSLITQDKEVTTLNPWMVANYLVQGMLNTSKGITSRDLIICNH